MKFLIYLFLLFCPSVLGAQAYNRFARLSRPEKKWVLAHPFVAKKAFHTTLQVQQDVDSLKQLGILGADLNGGKLDAFKHAYWMASLSLKIGSRKALKLGAAHEKGNYLQFKKHELEDAILPDLASSTMDLHNNEAGIAAMGNCHTFRTRKELQSKIIQAIERGDMRIVKKDKEGNYLNCDGSPIDWKSWAGKWDIPKCLVASNQD